MNSLRLLDSYKNYDTFKTPTTILRLNKKESALLDPIFRRNSSARSRPTKRSINYKLTQAGADRSLSQSRRLRGAHTRHAGLGALGVTFGYVVAMDSPSARKPGQWHWASTMWHELSHVYVLEMTNHRVPRWFTEGLAVYEETAASPDWGDPPRPRRHQRHQRQKAAARRRSGSRLHASHLWRSGDRVVFPRRQDLHLHRGEVGLRQS